MKKFTGNELGYSMVLVIMLIFFVSIIGLSLINLNANSMKISKNEEIDQAVFYVAEAGINYHIEEVNKLLDSAFTETNTYYSGLSIEEKQTFDFTDYFINNAHSKIDSYKTTVEAFTNFKYQEYDTKQAIVTITRNGNNVEFVSVGEIDGKTRKVSQTLEIPTTNLFSTTQIAVTPGSGGSTTTNPGIGTLEDDPNYPNNTHIFANSYGINGNFPHGKGSFTDFDLTKLIQGSTFDLLTKTNAAPNGVPVETAKNNMTIDQTMVLTQFANVNKGPYTIDASKQDVTLYIQDGFNPKFDFNVIGPNKVNIVMLGGMTIPSGFQIKSSSIPKAEINLIVPTNATVNFNKGGQETYIEGNILIRNTPINMDVNKFTVTGTIMSLASGDSHLNGSAHASIGGFCAPNAKLMTDGKFELAGGNIIVKEFHLNGGGSFEVSGSSAQHACSSSLFNPAPSKQTYTTYQKNIFSKLSSLTEN